MVKEITEVVGVELDQWGANVSADEDTLYLGPRELDEDGYGVSVAPLESVLTAAEAVNDPDVDVTSLDVGDDGLVVKVHHDEPHQPGGRGQLGVLLQADEYQQRITMEELREVVNVLS